MNQDYKNIMKLENQLCFPLYAASRLVTSKYTKLLKPIGLTYTQYVMFLVLWEKDGISIGQLCEKLFLDNGTITPIIKKLQKAGYVERYRNPEDDRVVLIYLTEDGKNLQQKVKDIPKKIVSCIELSDMQKKQLYDILYEFLDSQNKK